MGRNRPKRTPAKNKVAKRARKLANRSKDLDQIQDEMKNPPALPIDEDLPGLGQFYCISCAKYYINQETLDAHYETVQHKRKLKVANEPQYSIKEAEAAGGVLPARRITREEAERKKEASDRSMLF